ncbi:atherin-like [Strigops habroptila]|uniref:atherin-like n=1 Tax=Strigops habroptila TaxID=2489341 RepID=UPI0011CFAC9A|nr:atherin-like [Strigops habroptila]
MRHRPASTPPRGCAAAAPPRPPRSLALIGHRPPPPAPPSKGGPQGPIQRLRLLNTLTGQQATVQSDSVRGPLQGALLWNAHAGGYAWRSGGAPLRPEDPLPPAPPAEPGSPPRVPPHGAALLRR